LLRHLTACSPARAQGITDRFARPANVTAACNVNDRKYCGGTHAALIDELDYIQQMGFSAVWVSPVVSNIGGSTAYGEAYHGCGAFLLPSPFRSPFRPG
jgi:glycosidase